MILPVVLEKPGIYLCEIKRLLVEETGTEVDISTICRVFLYESGFTRQKMIIAAQQSDSLRAEYLMDMSIYKGHPEMYVFVDKMGQIREIPCKNLPTVYGETCFLKEAASTR